MARRGVYVVFLLSIISGCSRHPSLAEEFHPFQGSWRQIAGTTGTQLSAKFDNDVVQFYEMKDLKVRPTDRFQLLLDPSAVPARVDLVYMVGPNMGKTRCGIYSFEGGKLKICLAQAGAPRPAEFNASQDTLFVILERPPHNP